MSAMEHWQRQMPAIHERIARDRERIRHEAHERRCRSCGRPRPCDHETAPGAPERICRHCAGVVLRLVFGGLTRRLQ